MFHFVTEYHGVQGLSIALAGPKGALNCQPSQRSGRNWLFRLFPCPTGTMTNHPT